MGTQTHLTSEKSLGTLMSLSNLFAHLNATKQNEFPTCTNVEFGKSLGLQVPVVTQSDQYNVNHVTLGLNSNDAANGVKFSE
jgi:hypothetical protein